MKKFIVILLVAFSLLSIASCNKDDAVDNQGIHDGITTLHAYFADEQDSKTAIQSDGVSVWWSPEDKINVFYGNTLSGCFTSTNQTPQAKVSFTGSLEAKAGQQGGAGTQTYFAIYPYSEDNDCDGQSITLTVPHVQLAKEGSFAEGMFPSVAMSFTQELAFYNVCGGACFSVANEGICQIIIFAGDETPLCGKVKIVFGDSGKPEVCEVMDESSFVYVNAPDGGFLPGAKYYASLLPAEKIEALGMIFKKMDGSMAVHVINNNNLAIHRSIFGRLNSPDTGIPFTIDTPTAVNLGLSVNWATTNVGAYGPGDYGLYYAWGETGSKGTFDWSNYLWCGGSSSSITKYNVDEAHGVVDNLITLEGGDDVAHSLYGEGWRIPTDKEWDELIDNCTWTPYSQSGINGFHILSNITGESIFLPCSGFISGTEYYNLNSDGSYWSSSLSTSRPERARTAHFGISDGDPYVMWTVLVRNAGASVRAVYDGDSTTTLPSSIQLNKTTLELEPCSSFTLQAVIGPEEATDKSVNWTSSNNQIIKVENGVVLAVGLGEATVTAETVNNIKATCSVVVAADYREPEYVDLGLPSGLKWANCNLGAKTPEGLGYYYAWAATEPSLGPTYPSGKYNSSDGKTELEQMDDAASVNLGDKWRMPTAGEQAELISNCSVEKITQNGVYGCKLTGPNGNSIFLPATGCYSSGTFSDYTHYWSSSLSQSSQSWALCMSFKENTKLFANGSFGRQIKCPVRPVAVKTETPEPQITAKKWLTFTSTGTTRLSLSCAANQVIYYSYDTYNWKQWDFSCLEFTADKPLYLCGENKDGFNNPNSHSYFRTEGDDYMVDGDIMALIDKEENVEVIPCEECFSLLFNESSKSSYENGLTKAPEISATVLTDYCYCRMFERCRNLAKAPVLPATKLQKGCYMSMFYGCGSLSLAPELPSTSLAESCYKEMFSGCGNLSSAPELPANLLATSCYQGMFSGCWSLITAPELPATALSPSCYSGMFRRCTSLTTAPKLPATTMAAGCYREMFYGCSNLSSVPDLPAMILAEACYASMFHDCPNLSVAPEMQATTLAERCCYAMFYDCVNLETVPNLTAQKLAAHCYWDMFSGCRRLISAPVLSATAMADNCYQGMFSRCTSLITAPSLPAKQLAVGCYAEMFRGCTALTIAPELPATTLERECYRDMFQECTSLTTSPELLATTMTAACYSGMFSGCTALDLAPELPANSLAAHCYGGMFSGCTSLINAPSLPAKQLAVGCYAGMFSGCTSLINAPELPANSLADGCYQNMFYRCTNLLTAPQLRAGSLKSECYRGMFYGCSNIKSIICLAYININNNSVFDWLQGVSSSGVFYKNPLTETWPSGPSGIPEGWTVVDYDL